MSGRFVAVGVVALASLVFGACGGDDDSTAAVTEPEAVSDAEFCEAMEHLIVLLAPSGPTSPSDTEAAFTEAAGWFEQARQGAPASISEDVVAYAAAYDEYTQFLEESGFNLDVVFSTTAGRDLAVDTSHTLTVPIVEYTTNECGLDFGNEG